MEYIFRLSRICRDTEEDQQTQRLQGDLISLPPFQDKRIGIVHETVQWTEDSASSDLSVSRITISFLVHILDAAHLCNTRAPQVNVNASS
jgi:hypothetical protein